MELTTNELLTLLGRKEVENYVLRRELAAALRTLSEVRDAMSSDLEQRPESADERE